jgi:hypothetical protein
MAGVGAIKPSLAHANHRERISVDQHLLPDDGRVQAETALPVLITKHRYRMAALLQVILSAKQAARRGAYVAYAEIVAGDKFANGTLSAALEGDSHVDFRGAEHSIEHAVAVTNVPIHGVGKAV